CINTYTRIYTLTIRLNQSESCLPPSMLANLPRIKVSVTIPENSKFPPGLVLLPLQASSHSRSLPGERGSVFGGGTNVFILDSGISLGLPPWNEQRILPRSPTNSRPSSFSSPSPRSGRVSGSSSGRAGF